MKWYEKTPWWGDYVRTTDDYTNFNLKHFIRDFLLQPRLRYMVYFRYANCSNIGGAKYILRMLMFKMCHKYGLEIKAGTQIGSGFCLIHPYNITITPHAKIGSNCNIMKGATVGFCASGKKPGSPTIGNEVYMGLNSTIIGGITIGDDVMIAPNTFVNVDVPSHSIVIGNPCKIMPREGATKDYLNYKYIEEKYVRSKERNRVDNYTCL